MKIAISGGTGFIGSHLIGFLQNRGHEITVISRNFRADANGVRYFTWDQLDGQPDLLEGTGAIVNLAGESVNQRWTAVAKERILQSRLSATNRIANVVERLTAKPLVVNGSGMSIYGTSERAVFDETSSHRLTDYLGEVVEQWEAAADQIKHTRVVKLRIGLVLGKGGGALPKMLLPYKLGVGGRVGSGRQWISWIHIEDMSSLIAFCIENEAISGPVNAVGPNPVTNNEFGRTAGRVLRRPHYFPVPAFMMKLIFGELSVLLLEGQRVLPKKVVGHGFRFRFNTLDEALADITGSHSQ